MKGPNLYLYKWKALLTKGSPEVRNGRRAKQKVPMDAIMATSVKMKAQVQKGKIAIQNLSVMYAS